MLAKLCLFGIKIWAHCCSSAYLHNFEIYLGKKHTVVSPRGLYYDVVMSLSQHMRNKNHCLFMDNLYSSVNLFLNLHKHQIYACGTIRGNRKYLPNDIKKPHHNYKAHYFSRQKPSLSYCHCLEGYRENSSLLYKHIFQAKCSHTLCEKNRSNTH